MKNEEWQEYAQTWCKVAQAMVERGELPPSPPFVQALLGIRPNKKKSVSPPKVKQLAWALPLLPPLIARKDAKHWIGVAQNTLSNADHDGNGPRIRYVIGGRKVVYPAAYLLEWLESHGMEIKMPIPKGV